MSETPSPEVIAAVAHAYGKARFEQSPELGQLFEALSQCEFAAVVKDRTAKITPKDKPAYSYTYADLVSLIDATAPELKKYKLRVLQQVGNDDKGIIIRTVVGHASGQWMASTFSMATAGMKPQEIGSAITYSRRYTRAAILDVAAEDDDGAAAQEASKKPPPPSKAIPPKPESTPWQRCLLLGVQHGIDQKQLAALVKTLANRSKPSEVTAADVEILTAYVAPGPNGSPSKLEQALIEAKEKTS